MKNSDDGSAASLAAGPAPARRRNRRQAAGGPAGWQPALRMFHQPKLVPLAGSVLAGLSIFAGVVFFLLSGCAALNALNIENPRYAIRDIRPRVGIAIPLSASSIDIDFNLEVDNPNSVGLRLDQIDFDLFINDARVLDSVSRQENIRIPARGIGNVQLRTRIDYQNIRSLWNEIVDIVRGERARYELRGNAYYDTPLGRLRFPVSVFSMR